MKLMIDIPEDMWERVQDGYVPLGISKFLIQGNPYEERPTGHWIDGYKSINCSVCGKIAYSKIEYSWNCFGEYVQVKSDYCPHCGARMEAKNEAD